MKTKEIKTISVHEMQANASKIVKETAKGTHFEIMRYSTPQAMLIPVKDYKNLLSRCECKECIDDLRVIKQKIQI